MIREDTSYYTKGTADTTTTLRYCHRHRTTTTIITKKDSRRNVTNNKSKKNNENNEKKMNSIVNVITGLAFSYEIHFDQQISLALIDFFRSLVVLIICSS